MISIAFLVSFGSSLILTPAVRELGRRLGLLDVPNERSSHVVPTPRNGGYAIAAAIALAVTVGWRALDSQLQWIAGAGVIIAVMGAIDDHWSMRALHKFVVQVATVIGLMWGTALVVGSVDLIFTRLDLIWIAPVFTVLWVVGYTNAFNFMDGINGIAAAHAVVAASVLAVLLFRRGDLGGTLFVLAVAGAAAGFLPWNLPSGSIFMGDTGSGTLGFLLGALAVRHTTITEGEFLPAILPMMPFILDTSITLALRIARRERLFSAHRSHFYQRLATGHWSHLRVTILWTTMALVSAIPAVLWHQIGFWGRLSSVGLLLLMHLAVFGWIAGRQYK